MRCQNCGIEIDTRQENADGTIICPGCGTVYRKKAAIKNEPKELQGFGHPVHDQNNNNNHGSFWKWQASVRAWEMVLSEDPVSSGHRRAAC